MSYILIYENLSSGKILIFAFGRFTNDQREAVAGPCQEMASPSHRVPLTGSGVGWVLSLLNLPNRRIKKRTSLRAYYSWI